MSTDAASPQPEFDRHYAAEQLRRSRHPLRSLIKGFYLRNMVRDVRGPTIDFGCGAGQLLARLPAGSVGLEVNPHLIQALRSAGLTVHQAHATMRDFELMDLAPGRFRTLVIAHVLEHLPDPAEALRILFAACQRIGVERMVVVVPGARGFASDRTHKTFIDRAYVSGKLPVESAGFRRTSLSYFPLSWEWVGRYFVFHEMKIVFDRVHAPA